MSEDSIERPLLLNQSMKDSIEQPVAVQPSPIKQIYTEPILQQGEPIKEEPQEFTKIQQKIPLRQQHQRVLAPVQVQTLHKNSSTNSQIQTIAQQPVVQQKVRRRYRVMQTCGLVCVLIGIVFIFAIPPFLQSQIVSQAIDQVVMTPDNQQLWGHFPGKSKSIITRNFTFHRLINEDDFLLRHKKPQFQEVSGFKIQELQDFLDVTYLDGGNKVKIRDWLRFAQYFESRDIDSKVNTLNMGSLGYWSTLKAARPTLILQQGLALLFTNMENSILPTLIGTGINSQFLPNKTTAVNSLFTPAGVQKQNFDFLWEDPSYGLNDPQNLGEWAQAALESFDNPSKTFQYSPTANVLKNYFVLTDLQLQNLLTNIYNYIVNLKHILLENHYCAGLDERNCTGRFLAVGQMADGWVTASPPPVSTITPNDTICDNNNTCKGYYPELYAFEKNVFWGQADPHSLARIPANSEITFKREQVEAWFDYNKTVTEGLNFNTAENCLLHIGNLDQIWQWGTEYDTDEDVFGMQKVMKRLKLENQTQAIVVWEWLKYLAHNFVLQKQKNDKLGLSNLFTQGFYEQFSLLNDRLQPFLLQRMVRKELQNKECHLFFQATLDEPQDSDLVKSLCNHYTDIHSDEFASFIYSTCEHKYGAQWQELRNLGVSRMAMEYHCQINGGANTGSLIHRLKVSLDKQYNCSTTPKPYCSNFELATKQWVNSTITLYPPLQLKQDLSVAHSFHNWDKDVKAFQYGLFVVKFTAEERQRFPTFTTEQLYPLFTFEEWFSASTVLRYIINGQIDQEFMRYVRWFSISITLRGFTMNRKVRQILFGYEDEFLAEIKNQYPPFGGDPSAPSVIALNDLNLTESQASQTIVFLTGKDDYRKVYQNYEVNGYRYSVNNYSWFDGNKTQTGWKSPWAQNDYFYGTTAKIFAPNQFQADNLSLLIPQVQRYGSNVFHNETIRTSRYGIDLYKSFLNAKIGQVSAQTQKYYQTLPNVFNVSSIYGLPLYITKNHFMNCTNWLELVDIYNQDYSILYKQISQWDQTFILVEPYTGVSFQSTIYLQNNYYHQPDALFDYPVPTMLPIFAICRSGNLTEKVFHQLYDPLVMALQFKSAAVYVGIALIAVFGALLAFGTYKSKQVSKEERVNPEVAISMQVHRRVEPQQRMTLQVEDHQQND